MAALEVAAPEPTFGELLRRYRTRARLSQQALSESAGVACSTVADFEQGIRGRPMRETAWRLASALALSGSELDRFVSLGLTHAINGRTRSPSAAAPPFAALLLAHRGDASQMAMACRAGIQSSWWARLEAGERQPSRTMVERIASRLGLGAVERDRLLVAAGFAPAWTVLLYAEWPDAAITRLMARAGGAA